MALDPHKWLYAPLEAGCALVRNRSALTNAFSYHPPYYNFDGEGLNYYDIGPQNSRGFRALKVWLALQHAGAAGYREMIQDDIILARYLYDLAADHPELEAITHHLSITTLRYVPQELRASLGSKPVEDYLNDLNQRLLAAIEKSGEAFISNAVIAGKYALRFCIVNFRASSGDIEAMPELRGAFGASGSRRATAIPSKTGSRKQLRRRRPFARTDRPECENAGARGSHLVDGHTGAVFHPWSDHFLPPVALITINLPVKGHPNQFRGLQRPDGRSAGSRDRIDDAVPGNHPNAAVECLGNVQDRGRPCAAELPTFPSIREPATPPDWQGRLPPHRRRPRSIPG